MASLSNINGLFDVHSTGAILFSNTHGTSGQILRSNGNAAPTWVAASTVIGGPYLPLTGGTLSGATATASGISFTVGGTLTALGGLGGYYMHAVRGNSSPGGNDPAWAILNNTAISSATYGWGWYDSDVDGSFQLWRRNNSTTASHVLTFDRNNSNATFSGNVTSTNLLTVSGDGHLFLGATGETPKIDMMYVDSASGLRLGYKNIHR